MSERILILMKMMTMEILMMTLKRAVTTACLKVKVNQIVTSPWMIRSLRWSEWLENSNHRLLSKKSTRCWLTERWLSRSERSKI